MCGAGCVARLEGLVGARDAESGAGETLSRGGHPRESVCLGG